MKEQQGKVCTKCKQWKPLEEYHKDKTKKDGRKSQCKECTNKTSIRRVEIKEGMKKCTRCKVWKPLEEYHKNKTKKDGRRSRCRECQKEYSKQWSEDNAEHIKERSKQYYKDKPEYYKQYYKQYHKDKAENNLQYISSIVESIRPIFKELNLPIYGYIYKFENIKTGHVYIGQSTTPLSRRYGHEGGIIKAWIKERKEKVTQKFIEELTEEDIEVTEVLDVACCQYHLDKLEAYWINYYDSYNNGYNNNAGHHDTDDGLEEFIEILEQHNLEFIEGQIVKKAN